MQNVLSVANCDLPKTSTWISIVIGMVDCTVHYDVFQTAFCFVFLQSKEEVMAVRLREADNIAAMAELQQQISELEIQVKSPDIFFCLPGCFYMEPTFVVSMRPKQKMNLIQFDLSLGLIFFSTGPKDTTS